MRPVPATVQTPSAAETPSGGRVVAWTAAGLVWIVLDRPAAHDAAGAERPPERSETAEARARTHPALAPGVRLDTGDGPPWGVVAVRPGDRPGRVVLSLDRLLYPSEPPMPLDPGRALSAALLDRLRADPGVAALIAGRVWDEPPRDAVHPYLHLGRVEARPAGAGEPEEGTEFVLTITCVSRFGGKEEAERAGAAVRAALHDATPPLDGHRLVNLRVTYQDVFRASDWRSTYGVTRLRAVVEPAPMAEAA